MPSGLIQSISSAKNLLAEMYIVAENASPKFGLVEEFLSTLFNSENKYFVIQRVWINRDGVIKPDLQFLYIHEKHLRHSTPDLKFFQQNYSALRYF